MEEKIHCNICNIYIDAIGGIAEHSSTSVHIFHRSNLEKILWIIRTSKQYRLGDSVISSWKQTNNS